MLFKLSNGKTATEAGADLQAAVQDHNLTETMAKEEVEFARERLIFEVCQPKQAKKCSR